MSDYSTIQQRLTSLLENKTKLAASEIHTDLDLESSGLDSFARIELVLAIEDEFGVEFSDHESANMATVDDIINKLVEKTSVS